MKTRPSLVDVQLGIRTSVQALADVVRMFESAGGEDAATVGELQTTVALIGDGSSISWFSLHRLKFFGCGTERLRNLGAFLPRPVHRK